MIGWVLPSPACATTGISTSYLTAMAAMAGMRSGSCGMGTPTSSSISVPRALDRRERLPAGLDEHLALVGVVGDEHVERAGRDAGRLHGGDLLAARTGRGVRLGHQQRAGRAVESHRPVVLDGVDRRVVHQLQHRRAQRRRGSARRRGPRRRRRRTWRPSSSARACAGTSRRIARVTMPSVPSLPTNSLSRLSPATSLMRLPPSGHERAVGEDDVEAEHVVGGDAVLDAAQAAGVGGDVAADRADLVRRRVRRVPEPVLGGGEPSRRG